MPMIIGPWSKDGAKNETVDPQIQHDTFPQKKKKKQKTRRP